MLSYFKDIKICIIGLGYVRLPLAIEFAKKYKVIGYDISSERISQLMNFDDITLEIASEEISKVFVSSINSFKDNIGFYPTTNLQDIRDSNIYIVTVPTPVDSSKPDLSFFNSVNITIGKVIEKGNIVIYISTFYPGYTEKECIPIIVKISGLKYNLDFFAGYSPERINPGDKINTLSKIKKITSGSTPHIADLVNNLYASIITAGTYKTSSIMAESAKIIENAQRDINIAFVNELAKIFNLLEIDTSKVLEAAGTKWNFMPFKPGLLRGHCIGVYPYYLAQKAMKIGYHSEIILAGRKLNDSMPRYISSEVIKLMAKKNITINNFNVLILGITFKENCNDIRNSKIIDIVYQLNEYGISVWVYDPIAISENVEKECGLKNTNIIPDQVYDGIILAVSHNTFKKFNLKKNLKKIPSFMIVNHSLIKKWLINAFKNLYYEKSLNYCFYPSLY